MPNLSSSTFADERSRWAVGWGEPSAHTTTASVLIKRNPETQLVRRMRGTVAPGPARPASAGDLGDPLVDETVTR